MTTKMESLLRFAFNDLPAWGNIGALANRQIDAVRFQYQFNDLSLNQTTSRSYQVLTMSKNGFSNAATRFIAGIV